MHPDAGESYPFASLLPAPPHFAASCRYVVPTWIRNAQIKKRRLPSSRRSPPGSCLCKGGSPTRSPPKLSNAVYLRECTGGRLRPPTVHSMSAPLSATEPQQTHETSRVTNDFSIQVATVNGSGSQTANL